MEQLIAKIEEITEEIRFSGVVSLSGPEGALYEKAFGCRDMGNGLENTTATRFGTASGTKLFTALGIGVLIDRGELKPDMTVCSIHPDFTGFIHKDATLLHLLTHTSGVFDYLDEEIIEDFDNFFVEIPWYNLETPSDYLPLFKGESPKFAPGERFSYSNGGYVLLGMIIEKVTGKLYRDFITEEVLRPAGMTDSGFFALNCLPGNTAQGYQEDRKTTNIFNLPIRGGGDGGMFTTAGDLKAFWRSLFSHRILSEDLTREFLKTRHPFNDLCGYGSGIYKRLDDRMFYIVGGDAGVGFDSRYLPEKDMTFSILSNITDGEGKVRPPIREYIENILQ